MNSAPVITLLRSNDAEGTEYRLRILGNLNNGVLVAYDQDTCLGYWTWTAA